MRCIYCLENSSATRGLAHVAPEGLGPHDLTLPLGAVCDACNNYLSRLDTAFLAHPVVSLAIQFLGVHGKDRRPRAQLGNVRRDVHPGTITIPVAEPIVVAHPDGSRTATVTPLVAREFDLSRFRRALFHIAFNTVAAQDGVERVLGSTFDSARRYIRAPLKNERFAFAQYINLERGFAPDLLLYLGRHKEAEIAAIMVAKAAVFAVDLADTGQLSAWAAKELPAGHQIVGADVDVPREPKAKNAKRYRISIELPRVGH